MSTRKRPLAPWNLDPLAPSCVTFPARFSRTYKRIFPRLSGPVRTCTGRVSPTRAAACFREFSPQMRNAPTHARRKSCKRKKIACVTLCHLRFCRTCARAAPLSSPSAPWPLDPLAAIFHLMSPSFSSGLDRRWEFERRRLGLGAGVRLGAKVKTPTRSPARRGPGPCRPAAPGSSPRAEARGRCA